MAEHTEEYAYEANREEENSQPRINGVAQKFISDLKSEKKKLGTSFPLCTLLIDEAIQRIYSTGRIPGKELYADVYKQKPIKLTQKVFVPIKQFPKLLGPKGNSLRRLQEETQCKISIKGRNSIRDRNKEEQLRNSGDPKYAHLNKDLYYEISTISSPAESYARIAYALAEVRKYLVPDKNDEISHQQLRELMEMDPESAKAVQGIHPTMFKSILEKQSEPTMSPKRMTIVNANSEANDEDEDEEMYEYSQQIEKRIPGGSDHFRVRHMPSGSSVKRLQPPIPISEVKRIRETPFKNYKSNSTSILNKSKYKELK